MLKKIFIIFICIYQLNAEEINKEKILNTIDNYSNEVLFNAYINVIEKLKKEKNTNALNKITEKEIIEIIAYNYKNMLKAIASNESNFKYAIGLYDKNDLSVFQINVRESLWNINELNKFTKMNVSKDKLIKNHYFAGKVALHILIYNIAIHANYHKYTPSEKDLYTLIATYNNPINVDQTYINKAKSFLATL